jgi:hypothetical protein
LIEGAEVAVIHQAIASRRIGVGRQLNHAPRYVESDRIETELF